MPRSRKYRPADHQPRVSLAYEDVWGDLDPADGELSRIVRAERERRGLPNPPRPTRPTREEWEAKGHAERLRVARDRDQADRNLADRIRAEKATGYREAAHQLRQEAKTSNDPGPLLGAAELEDQLATRIEKRTHP